MSHLPRSRDALRLETLEGREVPTVFINSTAITIPDGAAATPSQITVAGMGDQLTTITVTLTGVTHTEADDIDILLVSPSGQKTLLMSDCGGANALTGNTYTFQQGAQAMPAASAIPSTTYGPTNYDTTTDLFAAPAPAGPYTASFATFSGIDPNGMWTLYIVDDTTNGKSGSITGGWSLDVSAPPRVTGITRASANPASGSTVAFTVAFNVAVTGVDAADFAVVGAAGVVSASVASVTGSGSTRTVTVNTGTGDGTLALNLVDNDSIVGAVAPLTATPLGGPGLVNGDFTNGEVYTVNRSPFVASIDRAAGAANPTNASTVNYTVTFTKAVTGVDAGDFQLVAAGGIGGASIQSVTGNGTTYTVAVNTGTGSGTLRLDLIDNDSVNSSGLVLGGTGLVNGDFTTGQTFAIDRTGPAVVSINRAAANPTNAAAVTFTVTFSEAITGLDFTDFQVAAVGVSGASVTGLAPVSSTVYTVTVSTGTGTGTLGLNVADDDTIVDALGNKLGGAGLGNGNFTGQTYSVDRSGPAVASINRAAGSFNPTNAASVDFTVTFDEAASGVDATDFQLTTTGTVVGASVLSVIGSGATRTVTVNTGTGSGTIRLDLKASGTGIQDGFGNVSTTGFTSGQTFTIDKSGPVVTGIVRASANPTSAAAVDFTVTFDEAVSGVDATDFTVVAAGGVSGASVTNVTGSGTTYTVTVNTGSGEGTIRLDLKATGTGIQDGLNNVSNTGFTAGQTFTIDRTPPTVASIALNGGTAVGGTSASFTVTFTEPVTGVDASDFALVTTGTISGMTITGVSGAGSTYTVTISSGTGDGTVGLNLTDDDSIADLAGSKLGGTGTGNGDFTGPVYPTDRLAPSVLGVVRASPDPTSAAAVQFTVTFSENMLGWDTTDFALTTTGVTGASVQSVAATGGVGTYIVTVLTGTGSGTVRLDVNSTGMTDVAGNPLTTGFTAGQTYTVDKPAPFVVNVLRSAANPTAAATVTYLVTFSAAVTGVDAADFALTATGVGGASVTGVTGSGSTRTVTVNTGTGSGTVRLDVNPAGTGIQDTSGELLAGGYTAGEAYTVDKPAPVVVNVLRAAANPTAAATVTYLVTFSAAVTGVDAADFALTATGVGGASVTGVTGSGSTRTVTVNTGTGSGTVRLDVNPAGTGIQDTSGKLLAGGYTAGEMYAIRVVPPPSDLFTTFVTGVAGGSTAGTPVSLFDTATGQTVRTFVPFARFAGAVNVAQGDVNGDGTADIVVAAGAGGGPHVKVFDGKTGAELASFFAFGAGFVGGVNLAVGDVTGDGVADIIVAAGPGGGPHVKVFDGRTFAEVRSFFAYDKAFLGGVTVATGDVNGDGRTDIVTGAGPGAGPHVKAFSGVDFTVLRSFFAYGGGFAGGVSVAAGDVNGDGFADIITGAGPGAGPHVKVFDGATGAERLSFFAYAASFAGGVSVSTTDADNDGLADIVTGAGAGGGPHVKVFDGLSLAPLYSGFTGGTGLGGVKVG